LVQDHGHGGDRGRGTRWDVFDKGSFDRGVIIGIDGGGDWWCDQHAVMEVWGRNGKWLRTRDQGAIRKGRVIVLFEFHARIEECGRKGDAFMVVGVDKLIAYHQCIGGKDGCGSRRRPVNGKEEANGGKLVADFFFLDVEKASNVLAQGPVNKVSELHATRK